MVLKNVTYYLNGPFNEMRLKPVIKNTSLLCQKQPSLIALMTCPA